jgi:tetratricopeptide (TPR) repeat protein
VANRLSRFSGGASAQIPADGELSTADILTRLIQRFPYWREGRRLLAEDALRKDDVAVAYAESQALRLLAPQGSSEEGEALFIMGRCFLRRGNPSAALSILEDAQRLLPENVSITEERAAALALVGEQPRALSLLRSIPHTRLSTEGHAALKWLSHRSTDQSSS